MEEACGLTPLPLLQVFWRLWSLSTTLHCSTCNQWFSAIQVQQHSFMLKLKSRFDRLTAAQLNNCLHHSVEPQVSPLLLLLSLFNPPFGFFFHNSLCRAFLTVRSSRWAIMSACIRAAAHRH